ncbi:MAG: G-D-S-L family lipolytic protein, partial [Opitutaceae bacterium]
MKSPARLLLAAIIALPPGLSHAQPAATPAPAAPAPAIPFPIPPTDDGLPGAGPIRRAEWFQRTWTERRSSWAGRTQQDQNALVFLGDSITQGWGSNQTQLFPGIKYANRGISGDTTRGVLIRL